MRFREPILIAAEHNFQEASSFQKESSPDIGRWSLLAEKMREAIPQFQTATQVLHAAQGVFPFTHLGKVKSDTIISAYSLVLNEFLWLKSKLDAAQENRRSINDRVAILADNNDQLVSDMLFWHLRSVFSAQTWCGETARVLEIGGGYGAFARLWLLTNIKPCERYVIVDIPESLFFAEVCLRDEFGDEVGYFLGDDPGTRLLLVPTTKFAEFKGKIDIVVSVGSLQEMSTEWVILYMDWLDRSGAQSFYSLNYGGSPIGLIAESRNYWAPCPSPKWATVVLNEEPPVVKLLCIERQFVEAIYERRTPLQRFDGWSHASGYKMTRKVYIEGLERLRQDWTIENAATFFNAVINEWPGNENTLPKELIAIQSMIPGEHRRLMPLKEGFLQ